MRLYLGIAAASAVAYLALSLVFTDAAATVRMVAVLAFLWSTAMLGADLICSWARDRADPGRS